MKHVYMAVSRGQRLRAISVQIRLIEMAYMVPYFYTTCAVLPHPLLYTSYYIPCPLLGQNCNKNGREQPLQITDAAFSL